MNSVKQQRLILGAAVMLAGAGAVQAQRAPERVSVPLSSGAEATVFASVPAGFEPNLATDEELAYYGYPPRPDPGNARAMSLWQRAVHTNRVPTDLLERPDRFHRPAQELSTRQTATNSTGTSGNWSAVILDGSSADFDSIVGFWAVPNVATQVSGTANAYSSTWVGLDGSGTQDLIQDGTESDWISDKAAYDAWVEVLPAAEDILTGLPVNPGDAIYAATQYKVVDGKAYAYFYMTNFNTVKSVSVSIAFPTDLKYTGQSAEWVEERTQIDGTFEHPMPNYGIAFMSAGYASRSGSTTLYPPNGTPSSVATTEYITMYDTPSKTKLSTPAAQGSDSITFQWLAY
jgi:hypothetical protein